MNYYAIIYVYLIGVIVIIGVQFVNIISLFLNIPSWSLIVLSATQQDISTVFSSLNFLSLFFLFIITPLVIGALSYVISRIFIS